MRVTHPTALQRVPPRTLLAIEKPHQLHHQGALQAMWTIILATKARSKRLFAVLAMPYSAFLVSAQLLLATSLFAQQAQDNWYLAQTWNKSGLGVTNGGLASPYGVAIGNDGRVYVGDQGFGCVQVYLPNGVYSFSITNGFGNGQSFSQPRGMITDNRGNLYVADQGNNCVYQFTSDGVFSRKYGSGTGAGNGQLNGVTDVAVATNGLVYVVENANSRLSAFNQDGTFNRIVIGPGSLNSQLVSPVGVTVSDAGTIVVAQNFLTYQGVSRTQYPNCPCKNIYFKAFDLSGNFLYENADVGYGTYGNDGCGLTMWAYFAPSSIRFDHSGLLHNVLGLFSSWYTCSGPWGLSVPSTQWHVFNQDGSGKQQNPMAVSTGLIQAGNLWPCSAVGPDETMVFCDHYSSTLQIYAYAKRELQPLPKNAPSLPEVLAVTQRTENPAIVDVYYQVTDMDDTNTVVAMLVFSNGNQSLLNCIQPSTFVEGTETNINTTVPTGQVLHVAWNSGADWTRSGLTNCRVAILAKDNRQGLLDVHYLNLPADHGMPTLTISASPLVQSDYSQAWWWLLATHDPGIRLTNGIIYGVGGTYDGATLCNGDNNTTTNGQAYIYAKMNVRQATSKEIGFASQGPSLGIVNQWTPPISAAGRPRAINDYGFDTGNWAANTSWIVPIQ